MKPHRQRLENLRAVLGQASVDISVMLDQDHRPLGPDGYVLPTDSENAAMKMADYRADQKGPAKSTD